MPNPQKNTTPTLLAPDRIPILPLPLVDWVPCGWEGLDAAAAVFEYIVRAPRRREIDVWIEAGEGKEDVVDMVMRGEMSIGWCGMRGEVRGCRGAGVLVVPVEKKPNVDRGLKAGVGYGGM